MPITWQNVNAPDLGGAFRPLQQAGASFNDAFAGLRQELNAARTLDDQNVAVDRKNRLDAFQATIMGRFSTPQAYEAAKASGEVARMMEALSPQDALAGAQFADARGSALQQRALADMQFKDKDQELRLRPLQQQAMALAAKGDPASLAALEQLKVANPEFAGRFGGEATAAAVKGERDLGKFTLDQLTGKSNIDHQRASEATARDQARAALSNAATNAGQLTLANKQFAFNADMTTEQRLTDLFQRRAAANTTISSKEGSQYVVDEISKIIKDPKQARQLLSAFGDIASSSKYGSLAPGDVLNALLGDVSTGGPIRNWFWDGTGDGARKKLDAIVGSDSSKGAAASRQAQILALDDQIGRMQVGRNQALGLPPPTPRGPAPEPVPAPALRPTAPAEAPAPKPTGKGTELEKQMRAEAKEMLAFDSKGMPKRTEFSPEVQQFMRERDARAAGASDSIADRSTKDREDELRRALGRSREGASRWTVDQGPK